MDRRFNFHENPLEQHKSLVNDILNDCRTHEDLHYSSPSGIKLLIGDVDWAVAYVPEQEDRPECLTVFRGLISFDNPVVYRTNPFGEMIKNDTLASELPGGGIFDESNEFVVKDIDELHVIKAIVDSAHKLQG